MKKLLIPFCTLFLVIVLGINTSVPVEAANIVLNVGTISDEYLSTILSDTQTRRANWYTDYDYLVFTTSAAYWTVLLIPKVNIATFIFADSDNDATMLDDIDNVYLMRYCSSANPCYAYRYTKSTRAFYTSSTYTTNSLNESMTGTEWTVYYSNIIGKTQIGYYDPYCDMTCSDLTPVNMEAVYNLKKVPTSILQGLGIVSNTEDPGFEKLILKFDTIFGDLELDLTWMKEALYGVLTWLSDISDDLTSGFANLVSNLVLAIGDAFNSWLVPNSTTLYNLSTSIVSYNDPILLIDEIKAFFDTLEEPGTSILPVTGTVFGTEISFDMKEMIFDPFLPVAPFMKNIFSFVLWILFIPKLFKEVQSLTLGQVV
jgi:hypothetical protein